MSQLTFSELGLSQTTVSHLSKMGYENPTEIQQKAIPIILETELDFIGKAQTGTGKTAAFCLPMLELFKKKKKGVTGLILSPTRELAKQIEVEIGRLKGKKKIETLCVYGGSSIVTQLSALKRGVDIVVGTPGRVHDLLRRKKLWIDELDFFILDEADEMLNMGFLEEIKDILVHTNEDKRTMLFSATIPKHIMEIVNKYLKEHKKVEIKSKQNTSTLTEQTYHLVQSSNKFKALTRVLAANPDLYGFIFCNTKMNVDSITKSLIEANFKVDCIHGDISQKQRELVLDKFKKKKLNILVATDVAARGIDVSNLTHVINYSLPKEKESYIHRIGRTGRAGKKGKAITILDQKELNGLNRVMKQTGTEIVREKVPGKEEIYQNIINGLKEKIDDALKGQDIKEIEKHLEIITQDIPVEKVASALLSIIASKLLGGNFDESLEIEDKGVRLFISVGDKDEMTKTKLFQLLINRTKISKGKISDVKVNPSYSFFNVSENDAKKIIKIFKEDKSKDAITIQRANPSKENSSSSRRGRGGGGNRSGNKPRNSRGSGDGGSRRRSSNEGQENYSRDKSYSGKRRSKASEPRKSNNEKSNSATAKPKVPKKSKSKDSANKGKPKKKKSE